ncbi:hypothetical protein [Streptomyces sp. NPDC057301]
MAVEVTDSGADALAPHFALTTGQGMNRYWTAVPQTLSSADVRLRPSA